MVTPYHAKYFAYELTKRCASDSIEKLAAALSDAQVDLNPHQVEETFGLLRRLLVDHFGSHAVAGLPNLVPSQAIVSRSKLTNRRSSQRLSQCVAP